MCALLTALPALPWTEIDTLVGSQCHAKGGQAGPLPPLPDGAGLPCSGDRYRNG